MCRLRFAVCFLVCSLTLPATQATALTIRETQEPQARPLHSLIGRVLLVGGGDVTTVIVEIRAAGARRRGTTRREAADSAVPTRPAEPTPAPPLATTHPDREGRFRFDGLAAGAYSANTRLAGFSIARDFIQVGPDRREETTLSITPALAVHGRVVDASTGEPIVGATIGVGFDSTGTGADGSFVLADLRSDLAVLEFAVDHTDMIHRTLSLTVPPGTRSIDAGAIPVQRGERLTVEVIDRVGVPIPGARVRTRFAAAIPYTAEASATRQAVTDAAGIAIMAGLEHGRPLALDAGADGFISTTGVMVRPGKDMTDGESLTVTLSTGEACTFEVLDEYGNGIPAAAVGLWPFRDSDLNVRGNDVRQTAGGRQSAYTDAAGRVTFTGLPAGPLQYAVEAFGCRPAAGTFDAVGSGGRVVTRLATLGGPTATAIDWLPATADLCERASAGNLPIFIALSIDNEVANDFIAVNHFKDPEICRLSRHFACLLVNLFDHRGPDERCSRYDVDECAWHTSGEVWTRDTFFAGGASFFVPLHVFATPWLERIEQREYYLSERDLAAMMMRALRSVRPDLAFGEARQSMASLVARLASEPAARQELVAAVHGGNEYATALLLDLASLGVLAADRLEIVRSLDAESVRFPASALKGLLADQDASVRRAAATTLMPRRHDDPAAFEALRAAVAAGDLERPVVADQDWRWTMANVAGGLAMPRAAFLDELASSGDDDCRAAAIELTARLAEPADLGRLERVIKAGGRDAVVALRAVSRGDAENADLERLVAPALRSADALVREEAAIVVGKRRLPDLTAALFALLLDTEPAVRLAAADALAGERPLEVVPVLLTLLNDPAWAADAESRLRRLHAVLHPDGSEAWHAWWKGLSSR